MLANVDKYLLNIGENAENIIIICECVEFGAEHNWGNLADFQNAA